MIKTFRQVDGKLLHDTDCDIGGAKVCTCGLLNHIRQLGDLNLSEDAPEEIVEQEGRLAFLRDVLRVGGRHHGR